MIGDDERCVALAGLLPMRLLAERAGLTAGISAAMPRPDYHPDYDRGQVLVDLGLVQLAGGQAISDFQALAHLEKLIGPIPSTPTVWRSLDEADAVQVTRIHQATRRFRRLWWAIRRSAATGTTRSTCLTALRARDWHRARMRRLNYRTTRAGSAAPCCSAASPTPNGGGGGGDNTPNGGGGSV
jgi:hypothetical protein